jgi:fused signal recognition particle receptor
VLSRISRLTARPASGGTELAELEEAMIAADIPARLVMECVEDLRGNRSSVPVEKRIEERLLQAIGPPAAFSWDLKVRPTVVLIVGVNGSGKTTSAAKLAHMAKLKQLKPLLAAADTFRAAGTDQVRIWAERVGCDVVGGRQGSDAAAVAYDAAQAAVARGGDIVFVDTAGRMHTRQPLMEELQKVTRSVAKCLPGAPHETWLVLDATIGNNAVVQARVFHEAVKLTGLIVAKLDGSSKAGAVVAIRQELTVPVLFAGLGEGMDDLVPFEPRAFTAGLLGREAERDS